MELKPHVTELFVVAILFPSPRSEHGALSASAVLCGVEYVREPRLDREIDRPKQRPLHSQLKDPEECSPLLAPSHTYSK